VTQPTSIRVVAAGIAAAMAFILFASSPARAQQDAPLERLELRVSSRGTAPATVVIDRGRIDGVAVGDRVLLYPIGGGTYTGTILEVDERGAIVEMHDRTFMPVPGTRGEVLFPKARADREARKAAPPPPPTPPPTEPPPERPPSGQKDETFTPDLPLLARMRPVQPEQRPPRLSGVAYAIAEFISGFEADLDSTYVRTGIDALYENLFRRGGALRANVEYDYFPERNDTETSAILLRWLSYTEGGTRFDRTRWEVGRFIQNGMPEFGTLDGVEWGRRSSKGLRYGVSLGFMPEPDEDFESFQDLQVAGYAEWVSGPRQVVTAAVGFQKTWHDGDADRDLLVVRFRYLPYNRWTAQATVWIDFYTNNDNLKDEGPEVTQAIVQVGRSWASGSYVNFNYNRLRFPELLRQGEFIPPSNAAEITNFYKDAFGLNGGWAIFPDVQIHGHLSGWRDENEEGGAAEAGILVMDAFLRGSRGDVTVFASAGQYDDVYGIRVSYGHYASRGFWELMYELSTHHEQDFPGNLDDIVHQRIRGSGGVYLPSGWDVTLYVEGRVWDVELAVVFGFTIQKHF
jgi:hypothetical protein